MSEHDLNGALLPAPLACQHKMHVWNEGALAELSSSRMTVPWLQMLVDKIRTATLIPDCSKQRTGLYLASLLCFLRSRAAPRGGDSAATAHRAQL